MEIKDDKKMIFWTELENRIKTFLNQEKVEISSIE
jgi:hypothetical protein